jgi:hypothetical protein
MSKRQPTSTCVLCGAETPQGMRYCTSCAGKLLSSSEPGSTPANLPYLIKEARTIDAQFTNDDLFTTQQYPQPKRRRR